MKFEVFYNGVLLEVSNRANVDLDWDGELKASFDVRGETITAEVSEDDYGVFELMFSDSSGFGQSGQMGMAASRVLSGVLTFLREFTESYEEEKDMKPYQFNFSAGYELSATSEFRSVRPANYELLSYSQKKDLLRELISRPMLYNSLALKFGKDQGYSVNAQDRFLRWLTNSEDDFKAARQTANKKIENMSEQDLNKHILDKARGRATYFEVTLRGANRSDYTSNYGEEDIAEMLDHVDRYQIEDWINQGRADEIMEHGHPDRLVQIAEWGLMLDELIEHEDARVWAAVLMEDPDYADWIESHGDPEKRQKLAELGYNLFSLVADNNEDVAQAAFDEMLDQGMTPDDYAEAVDYAHPEVRGEIFDNIVYDGDSEQVYSALDGFVGNDDYLDRIQQAYDAHGEDNWQIRKLAAENGLELDNAINDDDPDVIEAAIEYLFKTERGLYVVEKLMTTVDEDRKEEFWEEIMANFYSELPQDAKDYMISFGRENEFDLSLYVDEV